MIYFFTIAHLSFSCFVSAGDWSIYRVETKNLVLTNVQGSKGAEIPVVYTTVYSEEMSLNLSNADLKELKSKSKKGFVKYDPFLRKVNFSFVLRLRKEEGVLYSISHDGVISYKGVRRVANGLYEYSESAYIAGAIKDKELAKSLIASSLRSM